MWGSDEIWQLTRQRGSWHGAVCARFHPWAQLHKPLASPALLPLPVFGAQADDCFDSVLSNDEPPEDRSCPGQLGLTGARAQHVSDSEVLLLFVAGSPAEAAALPTAIGSEQARGVYPKQTKACSTAT